MNQNENKQQDLSHPWGEWCPKSAIFRSEITMPNGPNDPTEKEQAYEPSETLSQDKSLRDNSKHPKGQERENADVKL